MTSLTDFVPISLISKVEWQDPERLRDVELKQDEIAQLQKWQAHHDKYGLTRLTDYHRSDENHGKYTLDDFLDQIEEGEEKSGYYNVAGNKFFFTRRKDNKINVTFINLVGAPFDDYRYLAIKWNDKKLCEQLKAGIPKLLEDQRSDLYDEDFYYSDGDWPALALKRDNVNTFYIEDILTGSEDYGDSSIDTIIEALHDFSFRHYLQAPTNLTAFTPIMQSLIDRINTITRDSEWLLIALYTPWRHEKFTPNIEDGEDYSEEVVGGKEYNRDIFYLIKLLTNDDYQTLSAIGKDDKMRTYVFENITVVDDGSGYNIVDSHIDRRRVNRNARKYGFAFRIPGKLYYDYLDYVGKRYDPIHEYQVINDENKMMKELFKDVDFNRMSVKQVVESSNYYIPKIKAIYSTSEFLPHVNIKKYYRVISNVISDKLPTLKPYTYKRLFELEKTYGNMVVLMHDISLIEKDNSEAPQENIFVKYHKYYNEHHRFVPRCIIDMFNI